MSQVRQRYNLIFVDTGRDRTCIHKMNVITGDYLMPRYISGNFKDQAKVLIDIVIKDRPDKIIFDKFGWGIGLYDEFRKIAKYDYDNVLEVDSFGLITYR